MKLLYIHPRAWTGEYTILQEFRDQGHEICVLEEKRGLGQARRLTPDFQEAGDRLRTLWYDPGRGLEKAATWPLDRLFKRNFEGRNLAHRMWVIRQAVRHFSPDAVICSEGFAYGIPAHFLRRLGLLEPRLVVSYIGGDLLDCPEGEIGKRRTPMTNWLIRQALQGADILRPVSPLLARRLTADGADPARIRVCPSHLVANAAALDSVYARRAAIRATVRQRHGIAPDAPLIVTLSSNHKGKGLHVLAAAWNDIRQQIPDCQWLLCGPQSDWLAEKVWPVVQGHGVHAGGVLAGVEVFEHLAAADVHLNPSLCEGLNMVAVEAAAVGVPTITGDGAGIADWIAFQQCGGVVPSGDAAALANAVVAFFQSGEDAAARTGRCRHLAEEFYPRQIADKLLSFFK